MLPTGLRAADAPLIQRLVGADQRLLLRLGALLQERLAVTQAVLGLLGEEARLRDLLMDRRLRELQAGDLAALAQERGCGELDLVLLAGDDASSWRVLALADEMDNPLTEPTVVPATAEQPDDSSLQGLRALLPGLARELRRSVEGLLEAQADDQRAAALEQMRYASPPLPLLVELMPMVLADGAELVRERALGLLLAAGARPVVVDLIRALQRDDETTLRRMVQHLGPAVAEQIDLVLAAILAALGRGRVVPASVDLCTALAPGLAAHRGLPRLLELLLPRSDELSLIGFIRALQAVDAQRVDGLLSAMMGAGDEHDAALIVLLAHPKAELEAALVARGLDLLISPDPQPRERMALAGAMLRLARRCDLCSLLAGAADRIPASRDSTVCWLLAELCRQNLMDPTSAATLAGMVRRVTSSPPGPHLVALIEQQLPSLLPLRDEQRAELAGPLAEVALHFRDPRSLGLIEDLLVDLGRAVVPALWTLVEEHPRSAIRRVAQRALGRLLPGSPAAELTEAVQRLLRAGRAGEARGELGDCLLAAAVLAQDEALDEAAPSEAVDQACRGCGDQALAAWGHIAAGRFVTAQRRLELIDLLLTGITADLPDTPARTEVDPATQDTTYILDERLGTHTDSVPLMLAAIERIAASPQLEAPQLRRIVGDLCRQWRLVCNWDVIWGPANVDDLARCLSRMASRPGFPPALRRQIAEGLQPRAVQLTIAQLLATVLCAPDAHGLEHVAHAATTRLIQAVSRGEFADDERSELAATLINFLAVSDLGDDTPLLRRRLATLISDLRSSLDIRSREVLRRLLPDLDPELHGRLGWAAH